MTDRQFRYYREDFGEIPVRVVHMDLVFDVFDDHTRVTSDLHLESRDQPLPEFALNAKNLEILSVTCPGHACSHRYDPEKACLRSGLMTRSPENTIHCPYRNHLPADKKYS